MRVLSAQSLEVSKPWAKRWGLGTRTEAITQVTKHAHTPVTHHSGCGVARHMPGAHHRTVIVLDRSPEQATVHLAQVAVHVPADRQLVILDNNASRQNRVKEVA